MAKQSITRTELAEALGASVSTIRKYEREFSDWLDTPPGQPGSGKAKKYLESDVRKLQVIHFLRTEENVSYEDMKAGALDKALESGQLEFTPPRQATQEDESTALVPMEKYALVLGRLQTIEEERARLESELKAERERVLDAEKRAAAATATQEERDRLLERLESMEGKLDALNEELNSERAKSWWQKFRGK